MSQGQRPGGLTALAVLNFIGAAIGAITALARLAFIGVPERELVGQAGVVRELHRSPALVAGGVVVALLAVALLVASGVGYLTQRRVLGRLLGTLYAAWAVVEIGYAMGLLGEPFTIGTVFGLVYPTLTAVLVNTVFRDDFVRR